MDEHTWRQERDDRTLRYAGRTLNPEQWICIEVESKYASRYDGQVAVIVLANLLNRMTKSIAIDIPEINLMPELLWTGESIGAFILSQAKESDPFTQMCLRAAVPGDFIIRLGQDGADTIVHGSGWNTYLGPSPSPITPVDDKNPFGAAFAAVIAASEIFVQNCSPLSGPYCFNTLTWEESFVRDGVPQPASDTAIGNILTAGVGSVGTAALYFLTLLTKNFSASLIDMDRVKRYNLDRSPIFTEAHVGSFKVLVTQDYLHNLGVQNIRVDITPLHSSALWIERTQGTPDIVLAAANEMNVRYYIESGFPPIQIYGTTGQNWQSSLIRHIPFNEACSSCLFPEENPKPQMACAAAATRHSSEERIDAALPFLSFAAGLMAAAEIAKLTLPGFPFSQNRVVLNSRPFPHLVPARIPKRNNCICTDRSRTVHQEMLKGSRYTHLLR
ncbi:MAG: ThiF family adenylyltransferase [Leptolyngbyaceae cyanobacterium bins.302]|nr:ThiF family adenylyltransferase [Leptolyngbyaceae cyanobacterium bins.302]